RRCGSGLRVARDLPDPADRACLRGDLPRGALRRDGVRKPRVDPGGSRPRHRDAPAAAAATGFRLVTEAQQVLDRLLPREGEALRSWVMRERTSQTVEVGLGYGIA